jgi:phosphatidylinositol 4-phosphatase
MAQSGTSLPTPSLPLALMVPPIPHHPHRELSVAVTTAGLVIKAAAQSNPRSYARVRWGLSADVEEVAANAVSPKPNWNDAPIIFGIVGIIRLYHGSWIARLENIVEESFSKLYDRVVYIGNSVSF